MSIFDILGPVMVGPSSSHTAGAVRIGLVTRQLLGSEPLRAEFLLHGSFASTGRGHGTPRALVAGMLGFSPEDGRIPESFEAAADRGFEFTFGTCRLRDAHPNSVLIKAWGADGGCVSVGASSPGGGRVRVFLLDGLATDFTGNLPTLIVRNDDRPGCVSRVTGAVAGYGLNVATLRLDRDNKGGSALMVIECDQPIPPELLTELRGMEGISRAIGLEPIWEAD